MQIKWSAIKWNQSIENKKQKWKEKSTLMFIKVQCHPNKIFITGFPFPKSFLRVYNSEIWHCVPPSDIKLAFPELMNYYSVLAVLRGSPTLSFLLWCANMDRPTLNFSKKYWDVNISSSLIKLFKILLLYNITFALYLLFFLV